jgi:hypothetical protein
MQSKFSFDALKPEKKITQKKYGVSDSSLVLLCDSVFENGFDFYESVSRRSDLKADSVLERYADFQFFSSRREDALKARDNAVFSSVKKIYASQAFEEYIMNFPESYYLNDAVYLWEKSVYEEQTPQASVDEFAAFVKNFPKNRFVKNAQDEIFFIHKKKRDKKGLISFIRTFPQNEHLIEAWKLFFTLSVDKYTPDNLAEFVLDYPEFPLRKTIIDEIFLLNKKLLRVRAGEKFGFIDTTGTIIIPLTFDEAEDFSEGLAVAIEGEKYGYIDKNGKWAVQPLYDEAEPFHDGVAIVRVNKKALLVDRTGTVISDEFDEISDFSEGMAVVRKGIKYGAVNRLGNTIISPEYDKLGDFTEGHAWFEKEGKYGIIDKQNFVNIYNEFEWVDNYGEVIRAKKNGLYGVINKVGEIIIPFEFERIENYNNEIFVVVKSGKYGVMDRSGCYYVNPDYDFDTKWKAADLVNGKLVKLYKDDMQALVNLNGKILADFDEYEEIYLPSCELIRYMNNDKYGYNDLKMHPAFKGTFTEAEDFINDKAIVSKKEKYMIIDKSGTVLFNEPCEEIENFSKEGSSQGFFLVTKGGSKGLLSDKLKWIIEPQYQEIEQLSDNYYELKKDGKKLLFDLGQNKIIWSE